jgi:hypothetical protein
MRAVSIIQPRIVYDILNGIPGLFLDLMGDSNDKNH